MNCLKFLYYQNFFYKIYKKIKFIIDGNIQIILGNSRFVFYRHYSR